MLTKEQERFYEDMLKSDGEGKFTYNRAMRRRASALLQKHYKQKYKEDVTCIFGPPKRYSVGEYPSCS